MESTSAADSSLQVNAWWRAAYLGWKETRRNQSVGPNRWSTEIPAVHVE